MKLSIAAGILSAHSALKVVSEAKLSTWLDSKGRSTNGRRFGQEKITLTAAIGSTGLVQEEKKNSPTLVNSKNRHAALWRSSHDKAVECTPEESSIEAHVGVLGGCAVDQICVANVDSSTGGFCYTNTLTSPRSLQLETDVCDPTSALYQECDCSTFDITTETGSISCELYSGCLGSNVYGCYNACFTAISTTSFENGVSASYEFCYNFFVEGDATTSLSLCVNYIDDVTCEVQLYGQKCTSCTPTEDSPSFDCSNVIDGMTSSDYYFSTLPIIQACSTPVTGADCDLCGGNTFYANDLNPFSLDGFGDALTCSGLQEAESNNLISAEKCPEAAAVAQVECCAPPSGETGTPGGSTSAVPTAAPNSAPMGETVAPGEGPEPTDAPGEGPEPTDAPGEGLEPSDAPGEVPEPTTAPGEGPEPTAAPNSSAALTGFRWFPTGILFTGVVYMFAFN